MYRKLVRAIELAGKSPSTLNNYARCLAHMALHFNCNVLDLDEEQVLDYLHLKKSQHKTPSESFFKHTVYGLRYAYKVFDMSDRRIVLPQIAASKALPVVMSQEEVKLLISTPKLLKHRLMIGLLYGCGMRCGELRSLKVADVDLERQMLHIKLAKGRKDRYVPLCPLLLRGLRTYLDIEHPRKWLFNGNNKEGNAVGLSPHGVQWVIREAKRKSGIQKKLTTHTLRHSYATHLLEMGMDIVSLKNLLGHSCIETTLIYLHVAQLGRLKPFSPLEKLYDIID